MCVEFLRTKSDLFKYLLSTISAISEDPLGLLELHLRIFLRGIRAYIRMNIRDLL